MYNVLTARLGTWASNERQSAVKYGRVCSKTNDRRSRAYSGVSVSAMSSESSQHIHDLPWSELLPGPTSLLVEVCSETRRQRRELNQCRMLRMENESRVTKSLWRRKRRDIKGIGGSTASARKKERDRFALSSLHPRVGPSGLVLSSLHHTTISVSLRQAWQPTNEYCRTPHIHYNPGITQDAHSTTDQQVKTEPE